ncbi:hypothetical protein TrRE_jg3697 [Triparma retinervis]|uniref:Uncharacterized protein n=1 Tax=Triparma retinervis TaxID=2557542 RepID=A0A9W7A703_9STRA|nr:hypothetical protein TrRE_jg3697 [Triparma retinervis]
MPPKRHSVPHIPHIPHIPHDFVKHDSGTLAKLDVINGSILDHVKVRGKRRSPLGGILSVMCVFALLYFGAQTFYNTNFSAVIETEVAITYESLTSMELECLVEACYIHVLWGPEFYDPEKNECAEVTRSKNWHKRTVTEGEDIDPNSMGTKMEHDEYIDYQFCVPFSRGEIIVIDNFAVMTNPKGGGVHAYWDTDVDRLGVAVPAHLSATGKLNKLFDGAHYMLRLRSEDKNTGAKAVHWINEFSTHVNDNPVSKYCPEANDAFSTAGKAEIYYKPTDITRTVIDNDVIYSVIGEIGGFLDIIIYAATGIMFFIWSMERCYYDSTHDQHLQQRISQEQQRLSQEQQRLSQQQQQQQQLQQQRMSEKEGIALGELVRHSGGAML